MPLTKAEGKQEETSSLDESQTKVVIDEERVEKSEKARNLIVMYISDVVLRKVNHCETAS